MCARLSTRSVVGGGRRAILKFGRWSHSGSMNTSGKTEPWSLSSFAENPFHPIPQNMPNSFLMHSSIMSKNALNNWQPKQPASADF
jgi:hypothetical protein